LLLGGGLGGVATGGAPVILVVGQMGGAYRTLQTTATGTRPAQLGLNAAVGVGYVAAAAAGAGYALGCALTGRPAGLAEPSGRPGARLQPAPRRGHRPGRDRCLRAGRG
jgi:hypothetical protein